MATISNSNGALDVRICFYQNCFVSFDILHIQVWSNLTNWVLHEKKIKIKKLREDCCLTPHESAISWPA
jgi:hypothetical protein